MGGSGLLEMLHRDMPIDSSTFSIKEGKTYGLVIVDEVNGFATPGAGNLAPRSFDPQIFLMVEETNKLAREFSRRNWPIIAFLDTHDPDKPEIPYPPHCIKGSGEENLVPDLQWLEEDKNAFLMRKDCINGYIGGLQPDGSNLISDWVRKNGVQVMVVVGICTDICVLDFVVTALSARNHGSLPPLEEVVVYSKGCATYNLPVEAAKVGGALAHPQAITHYMGLYIAKSRGALIADSITFPEYVDIHAQESRSQLMLHAL
ncbi:hypothetical protein KP509_18G066200 [Ceratopteris richardii]|nr:hypothetical protein KP509_18G066200 [Ceratopteris richardii]